LLRRALAACCGAVLLAGCGGGGATTAAKDVLQRDRRATPGRAAPGTPVLVAAERAITRDARARVRRGRLDGPVTGTRCSREAGARGVYSCVALTVPLHPRPAALIGHPYLLRVQGDGFAFCYAQPVAGEGATPSLSEVRPLPAACGGSG
jgi:hypothetical protein